MARSTQHQPDTDPAYSIPPNARILIVRLSAIGDVVRTIPAVRALRETLPNAFIGWAVEDKAADILHQSPYIDTIHILKRQTWKKNYLHPGPLISFIKNIRKTKYDFAIDFHGNAKSGIITRLSGAHTRVGFAPEFCKELNHLATNRHISPPGHNINRYEKNFSLLEPVIGPPPYSLDIEIPIPDNVRSEIDSFLNEWLEPGRPFILVHPTTSRPFKVWPAQNYATVCDTLAREHKCKILLTWGPGEYDDAKHVAELASTKPEIAPPMKSLHHFAYAVSRADTYLGGDTGPMHIASAMRTPIAAIFGSTDPAVNGPYRKPNHVMYAGLDCSPCKKRICERDRECMTAITPKQACDTVLKLIS